MLRCGDASRWAYRRTLPSAALNSAASGLNRVGRSLELRKFIQHHLEQVCQALRAAFPG